MSVNRALIILALLVLCILTAWGQAGAYYNSISTSSATFVTDLHNLINPHTRIDYGQFDETNVVSFASRDTTGGQRVVTCVYSGENYVYTPPFAWTYFSREHTWCQSWMPTEGASNFSSRPEYSDQHHLFPVNQNSANNIRSNHPLGNVITANHTFLEGKRGLDASGNLVYEPRASHKGDAARALLYMAVCYNGVDGWSWSFDSLNYRMTHFPSPEAAQDIAILKQWHQQDPPDTWEIARNEYLYSIQGNRNPFIDHPEYVDFIDFATLTKVNVSLAAEPTNHASGFTTGTLTNSSVMVTWTDAAAGAQAPSGYLLMANTSNSFTAPNDGSTYTDDTILGDGNAAVNIAYPSAGQYTFSNLLQATQYYFNLYSYNGSGSARNYRISGTVPNIGGATSGSGSNPPKVVVNEYMNGTYQSSEWVELLVLQDNLDMRGMKVRDYSSGGSIQSPILFSNNALWSAVPMGSFIVILAATNTQAEDTDLSDKRVVISATNTTYFSGNSFNIAGSTDAVQILDAGSTHIHALSHGTQPNYIDSIPQPKANTSKTPPSGKVIRFINVSAYANFTDAAHVDTSSTITQGVANDAAEQNFINSVLPVELVMFNAFAQRTGATLMWQTATETNNYGFEIERKAESRRQMAESWQTVGFIAGAGTSTSPREYSFVDANLASGRYAYRLKQIDNDGSSRYSSAAEVEVGLAPNEFKLEPNFPNPFNPSTTIEFTVGTNGPAYRTDDVRPAGRRASLRVFNLLGQEVATLFDGEAQAGRVQQVKFDASRLPSGLYFAKLEAGKQQNIRKMMLVK